MVVFWFGKKGKKKKKESDVEIVADLYLIAKQGRLHKLTDMEMQNHNLSLKLNISPYKWAWN